MNVSIKSSFDVMWNEVVCPAISQYTSDDISCHPSAKSLIWERYESFYKHVTDNYVYSLPSRHKIAACYTYAVLSTMPLVSNRMDSTRQLNARLALSVGYAVMATLCMISIENTGAFTDDEMKRILKDAGLPGGKFPEIMGDLTYEERVLCCFEVTQEEGNYNILLLSLLFYDWEVWLFGPSNHEKLVNYYKEMNLEESNHLSAQTE